MHLKIYKKNLLSVLVLLCHGIGIQSHVEDFELETITREREILQLIKRIAAPTTNVEPDFTVPDDFENMGMDKRLEWWVNQQFLPSALVRHERLYRLLSQLNKTPLFIEDQNPIIAEDSLRELDVIIGSGTSEAQRAHCLAKRIDHTSLHIGYFTLMRHLVQVKSPDNIQQLQDTLANIGEFDGIVTNIKKALEEFKPAEDTFLSFWMEESTPDALEQIIDQIKFKKMPFINDWLNESPAVITFFHLQDWAFKFGTPLITVGFFGYACYTTNPLLIILSGYAMIDQLMGIPENIRQVKVRLMALYLMQKKLISVAKFIKTVQDIHALLIQIPEAQQLADLIELPTDDQALKKFLKLLSKNTFQSYPSYLSHWGNICVAYMQMLKQKNKFIKAYAGLGTVDFLISLSQLLNSSTEQAPYCIADIQSPDETSHIRAEQFWSPLLDPETVITNSTTIGGAAGQKVHIITGPNARGKTTIMRSLGGSALLASTLGIASAASISIPSYLDFLTSINVGDDSANQLSLFKAVVKRLSNILKTVNSQPGRPTLVVVDEPFVGTSANVAQASANRFLKKLAEKPHALALVTSHLPAVKTLAEINPTIFANYYLGADYELCAGTDPDQSTYNNVALEIIGQGFADEEGFLDDIRNDLIAT